MRCRNNKCKTIQCESNTHCGSVFQCIKGECKPKKCHYKHECGFFASCSKGFCFPDTPNEIANPDDLCKNDEDCISSETASLNKRQNLRCLKVSSANSSHIKQYDINVLGVVDS